MGNISWTHLHLRRSSTASRGKEKHKDLNCQIESRVPGACRWARAQDVAENRLKCSEGPRWLILKGAWEPIVIADTTASSLAQSDILKDTQHQCSDTLPSCLHLLTNFCKNLYRFSHRQTLEHHPNCRTQPSSACQIHPEPES